MENRTDKGGDKLRRALIDFKRQYSSNPIKRIGYYVQNNPTEWNRFIVEGGKPSIHSVKSLGDITSIQIKEVDEEKNLLRQMHDLFNKLSRPRRPKSEKESLVIQLREIFEEYAKRGDIKYLSGKIQDRAIELIRRNPTFLSQFNRGTSHEAIVMSIDIRSSTELMLNSKTPADFSKFITDLCDKLAGLVIDNGGIVDKFTGDGLLAFFPTFYSGVDAGYRALEAATEAIEYFKEHYKSHRRCFRVVLAGTGLGVGIDWGLVNIVTIGESLSVVGTPVVYACRLSSTKAGTICVNEPAKELLEEKYKANTIIEEIEMSIKGSGPIVSYLVRLKGDHFKVAELPWDSETKKIAQP